LLEPTLAGPKGQLKHSEKILGSSPGRQNTGGQVFWGRY